MDESGAAGESADISLIKQAGELEAGNLRHTVYEPRPTDQGGCLKPFNTALRVPPLSHQSKLMSDHNETHGSHKDTQQDCNETTAKVVRH